MAKALPTIFLVVIVLFGALCRFYRVRDLMTFRSDQVIELQSSADILKGKLTLIGIKTSNSQLRNGAVMYYFLAPFLWLFRFDPVAGAVLQTGLSLAGAVTVYLVAKKFLPPEFALLGSFIITFSPLLVLFSRQTLLAFYPLFPSILAFFLLVKIREEYTPKKIILLGLLLGVLLQIHYATLSVIIFALLALKPKLFKISFLLLAGFLIGFSPMIAFELRHQFFNTHMLVNFLLTGNGTVAHHWDVVNYLITSLSQYFFAGNYLATVIFSVVLFTLVLRYRKKLSSLDKLAITQVISVVFFALIFVRENVAHYILPAIPALVLLTVSLVSKFLPRTSVLVIAGLFFLLNFSSYHFFDNHGWTMTAGWNLPGIEKSAEMIAHDCDDKSYNVTMVVDAENQGLPLRYFLGLWGKPPLSANSYGQEEILYVLAAPGTDLGAVGLWEIRSFDPFVTDKTWQIQNGFTLYRLSRQTKET